MRHYDFLDPAERERLFHRAPEPFDADADPGLLGVALGATLYSPATRPRLADDIERRAARGVTSMVLCLEDSIADADVGDAECNVARSVTRATLRAGWTVRCCSSGSAHRSRSRCIVDGLGDAAHVLTGFVLPKFAEDIGVVLPGRDRGRECAHRPHVARHAGDRVAARRSTRETRAETLVAVRRLLDKHREHVLAVRIGATDMSAAYGLRRSRDHTVYDVGLVRDVISDVVNVFGRADGGFIVTGPVWEYFSGSERMFKPLLRETPFHQVTTSASCAPN